MVEDGAVRGVDKVEDVPFVEDGTSFVVKKFARSEESRGEAVVAEIAGPADGVLGDEEECTEEYGEVNEREEKSCRG